VTPRSSSSNPAVMKPRIPSLWPLNLYAACVLILTACGLGNSTAKASGVLNATSIWTYTTAEPITSSPGQSPRLVYLRTEKSLIALAVDGGTEQWHVESMSDTPLTLAPIVVENAVLVPEIGSRIAAYSTDTGRFLWKSAPITVSGLASPRIDALISAQGLVIVARHDWSLTAYAAASGQVVWQHELSSRASQYLASDSKTVYLAVGEALSAYEVASGNLLWRRIFKGFIGPILVSGSVLYVVDESTPGLVALDARTQEVLWETTYQQAEAFEIGCLVEVEGRVLIAERKLIAVSEADGAVDWISVPTGRLECPVGLGKNLYVRNTSSTLYAFDLDTGIETGNMPVESNTPMKNQPNRGPVVENGLLIMPTGNHELIALRP
jgi:outer membrane protein assembly factor BamB